MSGVSLAGWTGSSPSDRCIIVIIGKPFDRHTARWPEGGPSTIMTYYANLSCERPVNDREAALPDVGKVGRAAGSSDSNLVQPGLPDFVGHLTRESAWRGPSYRPRRLGKVKRRDNPGAGQRGPKTPRETYSVKLRWYAETDAAKSFHSCRFFSDSNDHHVRTSLASVIPITTWSRHARTIAFSWSLISLPGREPALFQRFSKLPTAERAQNSAGLRRLRLVQLPTRRRRKDAAPTRRQQQEPVPTTGRVNDLRTPPALQFSPRVRNKHQSSSHWASATDSHISALTDPSGTRKANSSTTALTGP